MVKKIIQIGDKRLAEKSISVESSEFGKPQLINLCNDLIDTCKFHSDEAAGLSAVQIGVLKRVFVIRRVDLEIGNADKEEPVYEIMVNPEVEILDKKVNLEWEGCMSISSKNSRLFGPVKRPRKLEVLYNDQYGTVKSLIAEDFTSSLIQHEVDHLNGVLFLKYINNPENLWLEEDLNEYLTKFNKFPSVV